MSDKFIGNRAIGAVAEGRVGSAVAAGARLPLNQSQSPTFTRVVVEEVIFDPSLVDEDRAKYYEQEFKLRDISFIRSLPPNTIIGRPVRDGTSSGAEESQYYFPMMPPHLMMPIKAGEHVWAFFEENKTNHFGYWLFRITEPRDVDDLNQTHHDRKFHIDQKKGVLDRLEQKPDAEPTFDNGPTKTVGGEKQFDGPGASYGGDEKSYEKLIKESDAGKVHDLEDVPRFKKRPGDLALQGSNNALIVLGTDRTGPTTDVDTSGSKGKRAKGKPEKDKKGKAGAIDIVVGRGQGDKTKPKKVTKNSLSKDEVSKAIANESATEGDPDFDKDSARVYLSMKTDPDTNFNVQLSGISKEDVGDGASAGVIKADHVRIIARKSIKFMVQPSFDAKEEECAGIVIKSNGDVVFVPSTAGIVKLGGDDANIALLGLDAGGGATNAGGTVASPPLITTMGGVLGIKGAHGVFATKVMAK